MDLLDNVIFYEGIQPGPVLFPSLQFQHSLSAAVQPGQTSQCHGQCQGRQRLLIFIHQSSGDHGGLSHICWRTNGGLYFGDDHCNTTETESQVSGSQYFLWNAPVRVQWLDC